MKNTINPLETGIYTIPDASRLLKINPKKVRRWVTGDADGSSPLISTELPKAGDQWAISFLNLIELRFFDHYSRLGLSIQSLRRMTDEAKKVLKHPHPFTTRTLFQTDGRTIFAEIQREEEPDPQLYNLGRKNWALYEIIRDSLKKELIFDPKGMVEAWYPRINSAEHIVLRPMVAFGRPSLRDSRVPTATLYDAFNAENGDVASVARWFEVPSDHVKEAVAFEEELAAVA